MENKLTAEEILDDLEQIQDSVDQIRFKGQNEYDLHLRESIKDYILLHFAQSQPPTVTDEWVNVKDRLPNKRMLPVLLFNSDAPEYNQHIFKGTWYSESKSFIRDIDNYKLLGSITHWMPLPNPPKNKTAA